MIQVGKYFFVSESTYHGYLMHLAVFFLPSLKPCATATDYYWTGTSKETRKGRPFIRGVQINITVGNKVIYLRFTARFYISFVGSPLALCGH